MNMGLRRLHQRVFGRVTSAVRSMSALWSEDCVLVYTMGKVGSSAIESAIPRAFHTHSLYGLVPSPAFHRHKYGRIGVVLRKLAVLPLKRLVLRTRRRLRIVTFYRDPRRRTPSMFMQDLPFFLAEYAIRHRSTLRRDDGGLLLDAYLEVMDHEYPYTWVVQELARFTRVSPEQLWLGNDPFHVVRRGRVEVFIGRAEQMAECLAPLSAFLGLDRPLVVSRINDATAKWYAPIYPGFVEELHARSDVAYAERFRKANGYR